VHDETYAKEQLEGQTFAQIEEDISYIWECDQGEREGQLVHNLAFFKKMQGNKYVRFDEMHVQQVYPLAFYESELKKAGFNKVVFFNDFHMENRNLTKKSVRNFIIAEK